MPSCDCETKATIVHAVVVRVFFEFFMDHSWRDNVLVYINLKFQGWVRGLLGIRAKTSECEFFEHDMLSQTEMAKS